VSRNCSECTKRTRNPVWLAAAMFLMTMLPLGAYGAEEIAAGIEADIAKLQSEDLIERARAVLRLQNPEASAAIPALIQMLGSDTEFPQFVSMARSDLSITQSCDQFPTFGGEAADAIVKINLTPDKYPLLFEGLDSNPQANADGGKTAEPIAKTGSKSGELLSLLKSPNWRLRANAARALGGLLDSRAVEPLIALLSTAEPWQVRGNAAFALGLIGDARALQPLIALQNDGYSCVSHAALKALGRLKNVNTLEWFVKRLNDPEPEIRRIAISGIRRSGSDSLVFEVLRQAALHDKDQGVREGATGALGDSKDPRAAEVLSAALQDSYINVRINAVRGLGRLRRLEALDRIISMLSCDEPALREAAAVALGDMGDPRSVNPIINMLIQEDSRDWHMVVLRGLQSLSKLGHKGAADMLNNNRLLLTTKDWWDQNKGQLRAK
jgi:HEAT repeat protein